MVIYEKLYFPHKCMASCPHKRFNYSLNYRDSHEQPTLLTIMHSSRMRAVHCSSHLLWEGVSAKKGVGVSGQRGIYQGGVCPGGYLPRGVCPGGCLPRGCLVDTPLWTEWQTPVKTLPCRNYVADGNNDTVSIARKCLKKEKLFASERQLI